MTGFLGTLGVHASKGARLAGEEINAGGGIDSSFILKIRQAQPDVLALNLAGDQVTNFVKQYAEFGAPFPMIGFNLNTADAWAAGVGNLSGTWPTPWLHTLETEASKGHVERFRAKFGQTPENHSWISYIAVKIAAQAIAETGSTETPAMIEYLESGAGFDLMKHRKGHFRAEDHQLIQEAFSFSDRAAAVARRGSSSRSSRPNARRMPRRSASDTTPAVMWPSRVANTRSGPSAVCPFALVSRVTS